MGAFVLNVVGSATAMALLYGIYIWCGFRFSSDKAGLEMWWLPAVNCYRVVIRNIPSAY